MTEDQHDETFCARAVLDSSAHKLRESFDLSYLEGLTVRGVDVHRRISAFVAKQSDRDILKCLREELGKIESPSDLSVYLKYTINKTISRYLKQHRGAQKEVFNTNFGVSTSVNTFRAMGFDESGFTGEDLPDLELIDASPPKRRGYLTVINPFFLCALTPPSFRDVLMHEEMHHLYQHYSTIDVYIREWLAAGRYPKTKLIRAGELAIDCLANQRLGASVIELREEDILFTALSIAQELKQGLSIPLITKELVNREFETEISAADDLAATFRKIVTAI